MRVRTTITLPKDLLTRLDRVGESRSTVLERAAVAYLEQLERLATDEQDIDVINRNAERLNREAADVLEYQQMR